MIKLFIILILFTSGCAILGAPVGWGGTYKVIQENEESVTYVFDAEIGGVTGNSIYSVLKRNRGRRAVMDAATKHCKRYGKSPVPTVDIRKGVLHTQTFECR